MAVNILQPKRVDEGTNHGGLGQILGMTAGLAAAPLTGGWSIATAPALVSAGGTIGGAIGNAASKPASVSETPGVQLRSAMQRRAGDINDPTRPLQQKESDIDHWAKGLNLINTGLNAYGGIADKPDAGIKADVANPISNVATNGPAKDPSRLGFNNAMMRRMYMFG